MGLGRGAAGLGWEQELAVYPRDNGVFTADPQEMATQVLLVYMGVGRAERRRRSWKMMWMEKHTRESEEAANGPPFS